MLTGVNVEQKPRSGSDVFVMWGLVGLILIGAALTLLPFVPAILWGAVLAISLAWFSRQSWVMSAVAADWRLHCPLLFLCCF